MAQRTIPAEVTGVPLTVHASITDDRIVELIERRSSSLEDPGLCIACGEEASNVEPDARGYPCEACGLSRVYGAEELLIMLVA